MFPQFFRDVRWSPSMKKKDTPKLFSRQAVIQRICFLGAASMALVLISACQKVIKEDDETIVYHAESREKTWSGRGWRSGWFRWWASIG